MFFLWNKSKWCEFQDVSSDSKTALSQPDQVRSIDATKYFVFREAQHDLSEKTFRWPTWNTKLQCRIFPNLECDNLWLYGTISQCIYLVYTYIYIFINMLQNALTVYQHHFGVCSVSSESCFASCAEHVELWGWNECPDPLEKSELRALVEVHVSSSEL